MLFLVGSVASRADAIAASDVVLLPTGPAQAMRVLAGLPQPFTTSEARQALGTTRRVAVPLLEHLDRRGWTVRVDGQLRRVSSSAYRARARSVVEMAPRASSTLNACEDLRM